MELKFASSSVQIGPKRPTDWRAHWRISVLTLASGKTTGGYLTQVRILRHPRALSSPLPRVTLIMNATREEHGEAKHERAAI